MVNVAGVDLCILDPSPIVIPLNPKRSYFCCSSNFYIHTFLEELINMSTLILSILNLSDIHNLKSSYRLNIL